MEWFENWFDTNFYHILYQHRDDKEAELFIDNLFDYFKISNNSHILDLACGKGRHALYMAKKGSQIWGIDLSKNSIDIAIKEKNKENLKNLQFSVGDMRDFKFDTNFDFVFNLFTSFGYFENISDNDKIIASVSKHQAHSNKLVIDFLNSNLVREKGNEAYSKQIDGILFDIEKIVLQNHVEKKIVITDTDGKNYNFKERVQLFENEELKSILSKNNYKLLDLFGEYDLSEYHSNSSRSILIAEKQ